MNVTGPANSVSIWKMPPWAPSFAWTLSLPAAVVKIATRVSSLTSSDESFVLASCAAVSDGTFDANTTVGFVTIRCVSARR